MGRSVQALVATVAFLFGCAVPIDARQVATRELAPDGTLRVGVVAARTPTSTFVTLDSTAEPQGVPADLGRALAEAADLPVQFTIAPNSGQLTDWLASSEVDVAFLPVDEKRRTRVDFGPEYFVLESTYLVRPGLAVDNLADMDRPEMHVVALANTATLRAARKSLKHTSITAVQSVDDAESMLRAGRADAIAMGRIALDSIAARMPGSAVLKESFLRTGIAIAIPKGRPHALEFVSRFMEQAKASGQVARSLERAGIANPTSASRKR